jgi:peptide/nickel transport system permease protein
VIGYVIRRVLAVIPLLLIISFIVFAMSFVVPGDPARTLAGGERAPESRVIEVRHSLGLDRPVVNQYGHWLSRAVQGDLGTSLFKQVPVRTEIARRFPVTFSMALGALAVMILLGVPMGILAGTKPGSLGDRAVTLGTSASIAIPDFWLAMVLVVIFAVRLNVLPAIGYVPFTQSPLQWANHLLLPWIALGLAAAAPLARQLRGALIDTLDQDYIRTAGAKGLSERMIVGKHALKNAAIAPLTIVGISFAYLLGGTVILENIFSMPGLGQYFFLGLNTRDLPVIQGVTLVIAFTFVMLNLVVDLLYGYINPRVRLS